VSGLRSDEFFVPGSPARAAIRTPLGRGQVVLLALTPHFPGQPRNTCTLLFNPRLAAAREGPFVGDGGR
jgi:hypothetical protein